MFRLRYAVALAAAVCLISPGVAQSAPTYTWAGTWTLDANTCCGKTPVPMTLDASGNGSYSFCGGTISGAQVTSSTLKGTWTQQAGCANVAETSGAVEFDMATNGKSFTGNWRYASHSGWDGPMNGTCTGGACLNNGATPTQTPPAAAPRKTIAPGTGATQMTFNNVAKDFESPTGSRWCEYFVPATRRSTDCHVKAGATITFCNKQNFHEALLSLSKPNSFSKQLNSGQCFSIRFKAGTVKIYSAIHSQMRLVLFVVP